MDEMEDGVRTMKSKIKNLINRIREDNGSALIAALGIMLVLDLFAVSALALSVSQNTLSTQERRGNQALNVAEAGLNQAVWKTDNVTGYAPTSVSPDTGTVQNGYYEITMSNVPGISNQRKMTITGYEPSKTNPKAKKRRVEAIIEVAPKVLSYGMFAAGWIDIQGATGMTYLAPLDYRQLPAKGADMGSNFDIHYNDVGIQLNYRGTKVGEQATYDALFGNPSIPMGDIITAGPNSHVYAKGNIVTSGAALMTAQNKVFVNNIVHLNNPMVFPTLNFEGPPYSGSYKEMAALNTSNGAKNSPSTGTGVYTQAEFAALIAANSNLTLQGMIYVNGNVTIGMNKNVTINNGGLIIKGTIANGLTVSNKGALTVNHTTLTSKVLPGLAVYSTTGTTTGFLDGGTMNVDGLVYTEKTAAVDPSSTLSIKGVLMSNGSSSAASIINKNGSIIIQYDPQVTATQGMLTLGDLYVRRIVTWKEVNANP